MIDIREALLAEHSKAQTMMIVRDIGGSKKWFAKLMALIFSNEEVVSARAAWVLGHVAESEPKLVQPYLTQMLDHLRQHSVHDAVTRNTLKFVQNAELTEEQMGLAADLCFALLADPSEPPAVRAYSVTICHGICKAEPALENELKLILENCYAGSPAAVQSRAKRVLKELG